MCAGFLYVLSLPVLLFTHTAYADDKDTINVIAGVNRLHDNNLFRTSSSESSDNITATYAGIRIDKPYAQQRFKFDYKLTANRYQNNDFLDFNAKDYKAAWLWTLTPYLTGTLSADRKQQLNDFRDFNSSTVKSVRTVETQHFEADFSPHGNWHLLGGVTRIDLTNSQTFNEESDFTMNSVDAGLKYVFTSGNTITFMGHDRKGTYQKRELDPGLLFDTGFDETEAEAKLDWTLTGKSKLNMRLAHVNRDHDNFSQRNYSGAVGRVGYTWTPTGKTQLVVAASTDLSSFQTSYSSYYRNDVLSISPMYSISSKITAKASASISERTFLGDGSDPTAQDRVDRYKNASIGLSWTPYRSVTIGADIRHSTRNSNIVNRDFTDTTVGLSADLLF
jgi:exopolysaccharide biosynthesis operon protein EpsL